MKKMLFALACLPLLTACVIHIDSYEHNRKLERVLELPTSGLSSLVANTGAGNLVIIGESGRSTVEVQAKIYYEDEDDIELWLERSGDSALLEAGRRNYSYGDGGVIIDLIVMVPDSFNLRLDDGSGHVEIIDLNGNMQITDGSGHLDIRGGHDISIKDGSGHIKVTGADGNLDITDGSGHIGVHAIAGTVTIDDGSGNIDVDQVGALTVLEAGSGSLSIHNIQGRTTVQ